MESSARVLELDPLTQAALDAQAMPLAVLDAAGRVVLVNRAWRDTHPSPAAENGVAKIPLHQDRDDSQSTRQLALLGTALAGSTNGIFITDASGRIEWVNAAFCSLTGYTADELIGTTPWHLHRPGTHDQAFYERLWETILAGNGWHGELVEQRKDGHEYVVAQTVTPMKDAQGNIGHFVAIHEDITARKQAERQLAHLAHHDALTDLPNRDLFRQRLQDALRQAQRTGSLVGVYFLDLDRFKLVNDTLGHAVGDALLCAVADRLRNCVRATDTVARLGGDEFAIIQTNLAKPQGASVLARKLIEALAKPFQLGDHQVRTSTSIGITIYPDDERELAGLLRNADLAMYRAKHEGRNNYQFYTAELNAALQARVTLEAELRQALEENQLGLLYHPQLRLADGQVCGVESLIRWQHPQRGVISPADFIPVAEESGLIVPLSHWVLQRACAQKRAWLEAGLDGGRIAVNLSAVHFRHEDLASVVSAVLTESHLPANCLSLEITESVLMQDVSAALRTLARLHDMGVQLAIDDFGTGYSSLNCLRQFPVERLKIDQSFLAGLGQDRRDDEVVRAIIGLGHSLGLQVIAEGVERREQLDFLRAEGCDEVQGYLFGTPMSAEECARLLGGGVILPVLTQPGSPLPELTQPGSPLPVLTQPGSPLRPDATRR